MSVLIRDMEMPENCAVCTIRSWNGEDDICPFSKVEALSNGRQVKCPLIEIPPHGRLIDADALTISTAVPLDGKPYQYVHINNIENAPTIVPEDKEACEDSICGI